MSLEVVAKIFVREFPYPVPSPPPESVHFFCVIFVHYSRANNTIQPQSVRGAASEA